MMDPDTRRKRHAALWNSGTASARRFAIAGVIFAVLMLLRVVEPHNLLEGERDHDIAKFEEQKARLAIQEAQLEKVEETIQEIQAELDAEPWNGEIQSLKDYFVELREQGARGTLQVPQERANQTIINIDKLVKDRVIEKLSNVISESNTSDRLAAYPDKIRRELKRWYDDNYNKTEWYFTVRSKDETIAGMAKVLEALEDEALAAVDESKTAIANRKSDIDDEVNEINRDIRDLKADIKDELNEILPKWAQDSIGVDSMVKIYPWVLLIIAVTLIARGWMAGRHFHGMADAEEWTAEERSDPLISTPWTLVWRGYWGTTATVANYAAVILILFFCLQRAIYPPPYEEPEQSTEVSAEETVQQTAIESSVQEVADTVSSTLPVEVAYALMIALLAGLLGVPAVRAVSEFQQE